jgi:hypothetical protein
MMTLEESKVLAYLRRRLVAAANEVVAACFPGSSGEGTDRIFSQLEWFGYVVAYHGSAGEPVMLQITDKGLRSAGAFQSAH